MCWRMIAVLRAIYSIGTHQTQASANALALVGEYGARSRPRISSSHETVALDGDHLGGAARFPITDDGNPVAQASQAFRDRLPEPALQLQAGVSPGGLRAHPPASRIDGVLRWEPAIDQVVDQLEIRLDLPERAGSPAHDLRLLFAQQYPVLRRIDPPLGAG